jgi:hypothetical protein
MKNYTHALLALILAVLAVALVYLDAKEMALLVIPALVGVVQMARNAEPPNKGGPGTGAAVGLVALLLLSGCAARFEESRGSVKFGAAPPSPRCISLDNIRRDWGAAAKGSGFLAGAAGLAVIPSKSADLDMGLAIGSVAAGATAVTAVVISEGAGDSWVRECK